MVIATQNPTGYVGTYPLPEAQLDRFAVRLSMGYPTEEEEVNIISNRKTVNPLEKVNAVTNVDMIREIRSATKEVTLEDEICRYIVKLIHATRKSRFSTCVTPSHEAVAGVCIPQRTRLCSSRGYCVCIRSRNRAPYRSLAGSKT